MTNSGPTMAQRAYHTLSLAYKAKHALERLHANAPSPYALIDVVAERGRNRMQSDDTLFFRPVFANTRRIAQGTLQFWGIHKDNLLALAQDIIADPDHPASAEKISFQASPLHHQNLYTQRIRASSVYILAAQTDIVLRQKGPEEIRTITPALAWAQGYVAATKDGITPPTPKQGLIFPTPYALRTFC